MSFLALNDLGTTHVKLINGQLPNFMIYDVPGREYNSFSNRPFVVREQYNNPDLTNGCLVSAQAGDYPPYFAATFFHELHHSVNQVIFNPLPDVPVKDALTVDVPVKDARTVPAFTGEEEYTEFLASLWTRNTTDNYSHDMAGHGQYWFTAIASALQRSNGNYEGLTLLPSDFPPESEDCVSPPLLDDQFPAGIEVLRKVYLEGDPQLSQVVASLVNGKMPNGKLGTDSLAYHNAATHCRPTGTLPEKKPAEPEASQRSKKNGFSTGEKIGIGVGAGVGGLVTLGALMYFAYRKVQARRDEEDLRNAISQNIAEMNAGAANLPGIVDVNVPNNSASAFGDFNDIVKTFETELMKVGEYRKSVLGEAGPSHPIAPNSNLATEVIGEAKMPSSITLENKVTKDSDSPIDLNKEDVIELRHPGGEPKNPKELHSSLFAQIPDVDKEPFKEAFNKELTEITGIQKEAFVKAAERVDVEGKFLLSPGKAISQAINVGSFFTDTNGRSYHLSFNKIAVFTRSDLTQADLDKVKQKKAVVPHSNIKLTQADLAKVEVNGKQKETANASEQEETKKSKRR
jgi:hypothetical protein